VSPVGEWGRYTALFRDLIKCYDQNSVLFNGRSFLVAKWHRDPHFMTEHLANLPNHERAYRRLRGMILYGDLAPGQAVTIQGLVERLASGMTPVREAIRRLTAEGALTLQGNRRLCVPVLGGWQRDPLTSAPLAPAP